MSVYEAWLARKLARRRVGVREAREVSYLHRRPLGGRGEYAGVTVRVEATEDFSFASGATWPAGEVAGEYEEAIVDGMLDELLATRLGAVVTRIRVTLLGIEWHPIDSSRQAFYAAGRGAIRRALGYEDGGFNVEF